VLAAAIGLAPSAQLLDVPDSALDGYAVVLLLVGLATAASMVDTGLDGIFEGHQRYDLMNLVDLAVALLDAALVVTLLWLGHGLVALAGARVATTLLGAGAKLLLIRRVFPGSFPAAGFDTAAWRSIRGYTFWNSLNELATEGTAHLDKLLIPVLLASALVTPYALACMVAAVIFALAQPITDTFLPIAAHRHGRGDHAGLGVLLERGTRLVMTATVPAAVVVMFFGHGFLDLWIGAEARGIERSVLWLTAGSFLFSTFLWTPLHVLMGAGRIRRVFQFSVVEVLFAVALILVLTPPLGLPGLALAGLVANVATGLAWFVPEACRLARVDTLGFLARALLRPLLAAAPACLLAGVLVVGLRPAGAWLLAAAVVTALVALGTALAFSATRRDRLRYLAVARGLVRA
jgi:O-antigen/teichoic acid export membrane protein